MTLTSDVFHTSKRARKFVNMKSGNGRKKGNKSKNRSTKIHLVFDETKRREFLTGFHKRKLQRKKEAKEKFERELKEERKRIKTEAKESYKKMLLSHKPIPELENLLSKEYEEEDANVKVVELSTDELAKKFHWIGANKPITKEEEETIPEEDIPEVEECPGMELQARTKTPKSKAEKKLMFESEKDIKKALKKQATKTVKKSKIFQMKNKLEQKKQKKKSLQLKKQRIKLRDKKSHHKQNKKFHSKNDHS